jgi:hypothetical protein
MTDTAPCSTFSTRSNARRAAEKLLTDGTAPAVDYGIKEGDDGRFEIVWKTGTPATTGEIGTEIATATEAEPSAAASEPAPPAAPAATEAAQPEAAPQAAAEPEAAPPPAPAAHAPIGGESELPRQGDPLAAVETERLIAELERRGYRTTLALARQRRTSCCRVLTHPLRQPAARSVR